MDASPHNLPQPNLDPPLLDRGIEAASVVAQAVGVFVPGAGLAGLAFVKWKESRAAKRVERALQELRSRLQEAQAELKDATRADHFEAMLVRAMDEVGKTAVDEKVQVLLNFLTYVATHESEATVDEFVLSQLERLSSLELIVLSVIVDLWQQVQRHKDSLTDDVRSEVQRRKYIDKAGVASILNVTEAELPEFLPLPHYIGQRLSNTGCGDSGLGIREAQIALESLVKQGFVNGHYQIPPHTTPMGYAMFDVVEDLALLQTLIPYVSWLLYDMALSKEIP